MNWAEDHWPARCRVEGKEEGETGAGGEIEIGKGEGEGEGEKKG